MVKVKEIIKKLFSPGRNQPQHPKITPDEMELMSFKERERLDNVKKELYKHRQRNAMLKDLNWEKKLGMKSKSIINTPFVLRSNQKIKQPSILKSNHEKQHNILNSKRLF